MTDVESVSWLPRRSSAHVATAAITNAGSGINGAVACTTVSTRTLVPFGHGRVATSETAASLWAEPSMASSTLTTSSLRVHERLLPV